MISAAKTDFRERLEALMPFLCVSMRAGVQKHSSPALTHRNAENFRRRFRSPI
jgi:hypothetical protein